MQDETGTPLPKLPARPANSHKGDYGRAMIVGGCRGMAGAVAMAGMACQRSGAGLTTLGVPEGIVPVVAGFHPAYMVRELVEDDPGVLYWANVFDLALDEQAFDAWAVGPGLGQPGITYEIPGRMYRQWTQPLVIDADGLNGIARYEERYDPLPAGPPGVRVLTPHPGEFARLVGEDSPLAQQAQGDESDRMHAATALAARDPSGQTVVVLKGHRTIIADSQRYAVNQTGNPGMATGGSGDVLTGILTALLAQGLPAFPAARLAVHVHGTAGDVAAARLGQVALVATDLIDALPAVYTELTS